MFNGLSVGEQYDRKRNERLAGVRYIYTPKAPTPGAYSQGILVDPLTHKILFVAGQTGNDPGRPSEPVVDGGVGPQTTQILKNILAIVEAAGGNANSLVSVEVFLRDSDDRGGSRKAYDEAYRAFFAERGMWPAGDKGNMPVRCQVWVSEIPWESEDTLIEIKAIAAIPR